MEESVYKALLKYAIDKEYQEGLTENEKRKIRRRGKAICSKRQSSIFYQFGWRDKTGCKGNRKAQDS
jgi:hypothetical protein